MIQKRMVKLVSLLLTMVLLITGLAGCDAQNQNTNPSGEKNQLGIFVPLFGLNRQYGLALQYGAELFMERYNNSHDYKYELILFDDYGSPREAVTLATKIVSDPRMIAGIGGYRPASAMSAATIFQKYETIFFSPVSTNPEFTAMGDMMFSVTMPVELECKEYANKIAEELDLPTVAVVYPQTDVGQTFCDSFVAQYEALGGKVTAKETYGEGVRDYTPTLSKISHVGADAILISGSYNDAAKMVNQCYQLGIDSQLIGTTQMMQQEFLDLLPEHAENMMFLTTQHILVSSSIEDEEVRKTLPPQLIEFFEAYKEKYEKDPNFLAAQSYDTMGILLEAINAVGTDSRKIRDYILNMEGYDGVSGEGLRYNEDRAVVKDVFLYQIKNHTFVPYAGK